MNFTVEINTVDKMTDVLHINSIQFFDLAPEMRENTDSISIGL